MNKELIEQKSKLLDKTLLRNFQKQELSLKEQLM